MSRFIDPTGESTYGLATCDRCSRKFKLSELSPDPNYPSLMVCRDDLDEYDPYRLAPRAEDNVLLPFNRPDTSVNTNPAGVMTQNDNAFIITEDGEGYMIP